MRLRFSFEVIQKELKLQSTSGSSSVGRATAFQAVGREFEARLPLTTLPAAGRLDCRRSSGVERFLGKEEVRGSNPLVGSEMQSQTRLVRRQRDRGQEEEAGALSKASLRGNPLVGSIV